MSFEIETKVLDIKESEIIERLLSLGAKQVRKTTLSVDWYRLKGVKEGEDPWFLRIRSDSESKHEVTWKAKSDIIGVARKHKEINFLIDSPGELSDLFQEIGLEKYAHQEKMRTSFSMKEWSFDIDKYPGMPAFLEIEGSSEKSVGEAIKLLGLEKNRTWAKGERILIQDIYKLNWYEMRF